MWRILPLLKAIMAVILWVIGIIALFFLYFNLSGPEPRKDVALGVTFSNRYATDLGVDWKAAYLAMLDDLKVRHIRIPVYWDMVASAPGEENYADIDWQLDEARKRDAQVILAIGQRVPRWPECHIPGWVKERNSDAFREARLTDFLERTVKRYRDHHPEITTWQVENEPFLVFFGECPTFRREYLDEEIALVKSLDARPVMVTDSGELSTWYPAASRADIFGTTMYRKIYKHGVGYVTYPIGPNFFRFKAWVVGILSHQKQFVVIELQGEPWASGWVANVPLEEQFQTMDEHQLRQVVDYAKRVQFSSVYLWGVEWWYWLKVNKNYPALWDTARELFLQSPDTL